MTEPPPARGRIDDVLVALLLGGRSTPDELVRRTLLEAGDVRDCLERARRAGDATSFPDARAGERFGSTSSGRERATATLREDRDRLGRDVEEAYRLFEAANSAFKAALLRWQMRSVGGGREANDHLDPRYDARILGEIARSVRAADDALAPLAERCRRHAVYRERLRVALEQAGRGEVRFVAGLDVDSLHAIWWELHADLLAVLGRTRTASDA